MAHSTALRHRRRRRASADKSEARAKGVVDLLAGILGVVTKLAIFIGFVALSIYLGAARHVVTGVNLTDAFLLAALALVLGLLGLGVLAAGVGLVAPHLSFAIKAAALGLSLKHLTRAKKFLALGFLVAVAVAATGSPMG